MGIPLRGSAVTPQGSATEPGNSGAASAADRIRDLQRKKTAATSLQAIPSRPADGPVTLEDIADMDDEAYERYVDKNGGDLAACSGGDDLDTPSGRMVIQRSAHLLTPG